MNLFEQNTEKVVFKINSGQAELSDSDVLLEYSAEENSLCLSIHGEDVVFGQLFDSSKAVSCEIDGSDVIITVKKANDATWHMLISGPSSKGIDGESAFLVGVTEYAAGNDKRAYAMFKLSADGGYHLGVNMIASIFLHQKARFGVKADFEKAVKVFKNANVKPSDEFEASALLEVVVQLIQKHRLEEAEELMRKYAPMSAAVRVFFGELLVGVLNKDKEGVEVFEELAQEHNPDAMYHLADCLDQGRGVKKDTKRAARLRAEADRITGVKHESSIGRKLLVTFASSVIVVAGVLIYRYARKYTKK